MVGVFEGEGLCRRSVCWIGWVFFPQASFGGVQNLVGSLWLHLCCGDFFVGFISRAKDSWEDGDGTQQSLLGVFADLVWKAERFVFVRVQ